MKVREGFVEVEGHRLAYLAVNEHLTRADEPAVVFIHGVLASLNCWRDWVPPSFREDRAWYALSLPAHHPSTVPADFHASQVDEQWFFRVMSGALQALVAEKPVIVVGHSTGGFSALNLAIHGMPNLVGIVSMAGFHVGRWAGIEGQLLWLAGLGRWAKSLFVFNMLIARYSPFVQRMFASMVAHDRKAFLANPLSQTFNDNIGPNTRAQNPAALFELFNGISRLEIGPQLGRIATPCYVFACSHDPVVPAAQSLVIAGGVPGAKLVVFPGVGHMPFIESADACSMALEDAIADLSRSRREHTPTSP
jgi:pimeloyl-ACP methyl ester carboxylesterase